jgi:hypothetical protein
MRPSSRRQIGGWIENDWVPVEAGRRVDLASGAGRESRLRDRPYVSLSPETQRRERPHSLPIRNRSLRYEFARRSDTCGNNRISDTFFSRTPTVYKIRWWASCVNPVSTDRRERKRGRRIQHYTGLAAVARGRRAPPGSGKVLGYPYKPLPPGSNTRIEWMHSLTVKPILQAFVNQTSLTGAG